MVADGDGRHYTYVRVTFYFDETQVQRIVAGVIHYVVLSFLDRKTGRARSLVVHGALHFVYQMVDRRQTSALHFILLDGRSEMTHCMC